MQTRAIWLLALGTVVVSVGTSAVVVTALVPAPRAASVTTPGDGALVRELASLRAFLEEHEATNLQAPVPVMATRRLEGGAAATSAGDDLDRLIVAIEHLEASLRTEQEATRLTIVDAAARGLAGRESRAEIDWEAWNEIWSLYRSDERAARDRVRLLTTDQLLARYGLPSAVASGMWYYFEPEENGPLNVQLQIIEGYVTFLWMEP